MNAIQNQEILEESSEKKKQITKKKIVNKQELYLLKDWNLYCKI